MKTYPILRNRYFLVVLFFIVWMGFFDPKDWGTIAERWQKLGNLEKNESQLNQDILEARKSMTMLKSDAQSVEKYARENYMMKKDNEDVFIVKTPEK